MHGPDALELAVVLVAVIRGPKSGRPWPHLWVEGLSGVMPMQTEPRFKG